jgi:hypothetical protein
VKSVQDDGQGNATGVTLDDLVTMEANTDYSVRFRLSDGSTLVKAVDTVAGETDTLTFETSFNLADAPDEDDIYMFGETGQESVDLVIKSIEPRSDLSAEIRAVDHSPAIFNAATGTIPEFESTLTLPAAFKPPQRPVIKNIQTDESVQEVNLDGSVSSRMVITLENNNSVAVEPIVNIRASEESRFFRADPVTATPERIVIGNLETGETYDVQVIYKRIGGSQLDDNTLLSPVTQENAIDFIGTGGPPDDVADFDITVRGESVFLSWTPNDDIDLDHYEVRFSPKTAGATWGESIPMLPNPGKNSEGASYPSNIGTYLIKAADRRGNKSVSASAVVTTIGEIAGLNVIKTIDEHVDWGGAHNNTGISDSGNLRLDSAKTIGDWDLISNVDLWSAGTTTIASEGT